MIFFLLLISLLPSFLQKPLRRWLGAKIDSRAKISMFAFVLTRDLQMGPQSSIGPFVLVRAQSVRLGEHVRMRPLAAFKVRRLELGDYTVTDPLLLVNCTYGPRSELKTGRHCYLQSFSMLEPSEGIFLGDHVALGGQCLVFCHGSWANYLRGAPYARGPVRIGNEVWVSWRSMILANSRIGDRAIIGAHSMVSGDLAANALYAGVPARMVVENVWKDLSPADRDARMREIIAAFGRDFPEYEKLEFKEFDATVPALSGAEPAIYYSFTAVHGAAGGRMTVVDLDRLVTYGSEKGGREFAEFLTSYGIRTDRKNLSDLR